MKLEYLFENLSRKFEFDLNLSRIAALYMKTDVRVLLYLAQFFLERENFRTNFVEKMKTLIVCPVSFFENRSMR